MKRSLIVALDFPNRSETMAFLEQFDHEKLFVKVGMELFYQEGPALLYDLKEQGHELFLDLKLHDIPTTVYKAMKGLAGLGADLVNVHAAGGKLMMERAVEGLEAGTPIGGQRPSCIAVTQLTSTNESMLRNELLITRPLEEVVVDYARLARESGLDGVVCSTWEVPVIREACGGSFLTVTPGIRLQEDDADDQIRVATPELAAKNGSTAIVVGRSITKASDPYEAYKTIQKEWMMHL